MYKITKPAIGNLPTKKGEDSDFKKYKKNNKSTTWVTINESDQTVRFLNQFNLGNKSYGGFLNEPFKLYLNKALQAINHLDILTKKIKLEPKTNFHLSENTLIEILDQEFYNKYISCKIEIVVFLIMSVESYLNFIIPNNIEIEIDNKLIEKSQIEKTYNLKSKFKVLIPHFKRIKNSEEYKNYYLRILNLNKIRNDFVHLKTTNKDAHNDPWVKSFEDLLLKDLKKESDNISEFINLLDKLENVY